MLRHKVPVFLRLPVYPIYRGLLPISHQAPLTPTVSYGVFLANGMLVILFIPHHSLNPPDLALTICSFIFRRRFHKYILCVRGRCGRACSDQFGIPEPQKVCPPLDRVLPHSGELILPSGVQREGIKDKMQAVLVFLSASREG